ncbi:hypothetical protein HaLaN_04594 [Haematococcus lacustris]|uniref:Uncharacterized protein n=1 Tax=Haematococcus lacustris TaxID=44745 RepID=A0A699Z227_HAELA|nr:hypothetical protein HaLaN_04594 [Haematococcus lacustris]
MYDWADQGAAHPVAAGLSKLHPVILPIITMVMHARQLRVAPWSRGMRVSSRPIAAGSSQQLTSYLTLTRRSKLCSDKTCFHYNVKYATRAPASVTKFLRFQGASRLRAVRVKGVINGVVGLDGWSAYSFFARRGPARERVPRLQNLCGHVAQARAYSSQPESSVGDTMYAARAEGQDTSRNKVEAGVRVNVRALSGAMGGRVRISHGPIGTVR